MTAAGREDEREIERRAPGRRQHHRPPRSGLREARVAGGVAENVDGGRQDRQRVASADDGHDGADDVVGHADHQQRAHGRPADPVHDERDQAGWAHAERVVDDRGRIHGAVIARAARPPSTAAAHPVRRDRLDGRVADRRVIPRPRAATGPATPAGSSGRRSRPARRRPPWTSTSSRIRSANAGAVRSTVEPEPVEPPVDDSPARVRRSGWNRPAATSVDAATTIVWSRVNEAKAACESEDVATNVRRQHPCDDRRRRIVRLMIRSMS